MDQVMNQRSGIKGKTSGLFRLMAVLLVLIMSSMTVAEAAECASETQAVELISISDTGHSDEAPSQEDAGKHGICPHGHCHSGSVAAARLLGLDGLVDRASSGFSSNADQFALSAHSSRLKRPPRV